jgi:hypothetical protein
MDEREFFDERTEQKNHLLLCPHCSQENEYQVNWLVRRKRQQPPRGADDLTRAKFAKASSYMLRRDDILGCKNIRCRKRFEVTTLQSVAYLQDERVEHGVDREARIRAAFGRRPTG